MLRTVYKLKNIYTLNQLYHSYYRKLLVGLEYLFFRSGPMTMGASQLCGFTKSDENLQLKAEKIDKQLSELHKALFIESNPSPVKYAASLLKLSSADVRLPLVKVKEETKKEVEKALKVAKLL